MKTKIKTHLTKFKERLSGRRLKLMALAFTAPALLMLSVSGVPRVLADSLSELRERSSQLQSEISEGNQRADELRERGNELQAAVEALDHQIEQINRQIELISNRVAELEEELKQAQAELERQRELLRANMRALYKRGGASTVELLVASDSFSAFIDEQEYLERLKTSIQDSAEQVAELEKQIRAQRDEQKELLAQEEAAKRSLDSTRAQRASLLEETRGEEARYRDHIAGLRERQREVENRITQMILAGSFVNLGRVEAGQMVGRVGMTGFTFGPHLHFEYRNATNQPIDPGWSGGASLGHGLTWPLPQYSHVSQDYGCSSIQYANRGPGCPAGRPFLHTGIDIVAGIGTPIVAAKSGDIIWRGDHGDGYGIKVIIRHDDGTFSYYAHLNP